MINCADGSFPYRQNYFLPCSRIMHINIRFEFGILYASYKYNMLSEKELGEMVR